MGTNKVPERVGIRAMKTNGTYETNGTYVSDWTRIGGSHKSHLSYKACRAEGLAKADPIRGRHAGLRESPGIRGRFDANS